MTFNSWILENEYTKVRGLGDRLVLMEKQFNWKKFIPIISSAFYDNKEQGGIPHTYEIVLIKCMLLQSWYGLSDPELEFQCYDRLSFRNFLGVQKKIPDFTTIWKIRERLIKSGKEKEIWQEVQNKLDNRGYKVEEGHIQDASFIEQDLGKKRYNHEKKAKELNSKIIKSEKQK